jgi:adenosylcobinamide-GDP ribazoletransferase
MRLFFIAFQFLTIIPLPFAVRCEERDLGRSMAFFPLVGLALGGVLAGADFLLSHFFPRQVTDLLLIAIMTAVTGALHLDGLADVCDGLAARGGRERFLAVMKDSHIGAVGVVGLVLGLLLKYEALLAVPAEIKREALFLFPAAARFSQVVITVGARQARSDGLGSLFIGGAGGLQFAVAGITALAASFLLLGFKGVCCLLAVGVVTLGLKAWFQRRLGGVTGDVIGCVSELGEIVCLLLLVLTFGGALT